MYTIIKNVELFTDTSNKGVDFPGSLNNHGIKYSVKHEKHMKSLFCHAILQQSDKFEKENVVSHMYQKVILNLIAN